LKWRMVPQQLVNRLPANCEVKHARLAKTLVTKLAEKAQSHDESVGTTLSLSAAEWKELCGAAADNTPGHQSADLTDLRLYQHVKSAGSCFQPLPTGTWTSDVNVARGFVADNVWCVHRTDRSVHGDSVAHARATHCASAAHPDPRTCHPLYMSRCAYAAHATQAFGGLRRVHPQGRCAELAHLPCTALHGHRPSKAPLLHDQRGFAHRTPRTTLSDPRAASAWLALLRSEKSIGKGQ
jgi:hypothetical protein